MSDGDAAGQLQPSESIAAIDALRRAGAERIDPVRFHFVATLAARADEHDGPVREALDRRLARAVSECLARCGQAANLDPAQDTCGEPERSQAGPLAELVAGLDRHAGENGGEMKSVHRFRDAWALLSLDRQVADTLVAEPDNAGPLNSQLLFLRAIRSMRNASPDYLARFMIYVDTLLWLDRARPSAQPSKEATEREARKASPARRRKVRAAT